MIQYTEPGFMNAGGADRACEAEAMDGGDSAEAERLTPDAELAEREGGTAPGFLSSGGSRGTNEATAMGDEGSAEAEPSTARHGAKGVTRAGLSEDQRGAKGVTRALPTAQGLLSRRTLAG